MLTAFLWLLQAPELSDRVVQLITATITHQTDNNLQDTDMDFFLDFDMAVLGQPKKGSHS